MPSTLGRRRFLAASSTAIAAPYFVPASALGQEGKPAPSEQITIGIIGAGGQGSWNMNQFLGFEDCRVVAVCDVDAGRVAKMAEVVNKKYGNADCKEYHDFRELVARPDIDAVVIATPDHWHALIALAALRSGKDVYCEKPITHTFEEGRLLADEVAKHQRIWQTGSQQRSGFNFRWGVELVLNGHIGKLQHVEVGLPMGGNGGKAPDATQPPPGFDYEMWCGPSPVLPYIPQRVHYNWRWILQYGGGQLMDWIGHNNDIAHWGMGVDDSGPIEVQAKGTFPPPDDLYNAATNYRIRCRYPNGVTSTISSSWALGTTWYGSEGWVHVFRGEFEASNPQWTKKDFDRGPIRAYHSDHHHRNFIDCIKSRQPTICPAETSHRAITPGHLAIVAMQTGRPIKWDPKTEKVIGDDAAQELLRFKPREPWKI